MQALAQPHRRQHQELRPRSPGAVLDARLPAHLRLPVRGDLLRRLEQDEDRLGRWRRDAGVGGPAPGLRVACPVVELVDGTKDDMLAKIQHGDVSGVVVVDQGYGAAVAAAEAGSGAAGAGHRLHRPEPVEHGRRPSRASSAGPRPRRTSATRPVGDRAESSRTSRPRTSTRCSYLVPSILGMSLMQLGIFSALPARRRPPEAHPQAAQRHAAAALAARRQQRHHAADHRPGPDRDHRRASAPLVFDVKITGSLVAVAGLAAARRRDVHLARLRRRLVRQDRGLGERDGQRDPVPAHVPVGHVLPDRRHAGRAPGRRPLPAADLPVRRAAPGRWSTARRSRRCGSAWRCSPAGPSSASGSRRASSSGSDAVGRDRGQSLPALLVDDLGERAPAAGPRRGGERRRGRPGSRTTAGTRSSGRPGSRAAAGRGPARRPWPGRCRSRAPRRRAACSRRPGRGRTGSTAARRARAGSA